MSARSHSLTIYFYRHPRVRLVVEAILVAFAAYFAAIASNWMSDKLKADGLTDLAISFVAVLLVSTGALFLFWQLQAGPDAELQKRSKILLNARSQLDEALAAELSELGSNPTLDQAGVAKANINRLVRGLYRCLDANYADSDVPGSRVNFEVTFMTRDYADGFVTIIAWANRDGRAPKSLAQRPAKPDVYESTVSAQVYREASSQLPTLRIIEDTHATHDYSELYAGQKSRIQSSAVYPVLDAENKLLGTLVAHCDKANFFRNEDLKFWRDLNELFGLRLSIEKSKLDKVSQAPSTRII